MVQEPTPAAMTRPAPAVPAEAGDPAPAAAPTPRLATRSPALDGLRGVAVTLVVLFHSGNSLWHRAQPWMAKGGPLGVHMFFVLSGFLITTLLLEEADRRGRVDLRAFAGRRARRLVPALVGLLGALVFVAAVGTRLRMSDTLASSVYVLTFTTNWRVTGFEFPLVDRVLGQTQLITEVGQTWSLAIEAQFYVMWAVALWFAIRQGWTARRMAGITAAVVAGIAVVRAVEFTRGTPWLTLYISTWSRLDAPLVGALAALALRAGWLARRPRRLTAAGVVGLAAILAAAFATTWDLGALPDGLYTLLAVGVGATVAAV